MTNKPTVSIVIPTLNRPESIVELTYQLLQQDYDNFEIVVVDQTQIENKVMWRMSEQYPKKVKYLILNKAGTTGARNYGVAKANGKIIIFLDDDCRINNENFITQHVSNYNEDKVGGVGGRVWDKYKKLNKEQSGPTCQVSKTGYVHPSATSSERQFINAPRGGNMSFQRKVIRQVGGFDERFSGNAMREETDFSLRVIKAGYRIVFDPSAEAVHLALPFGGSREEERYDWYYHFFHNETLFFLKHFPKVYLPILFIRKIRPTLSCMFYYGHGHPKWLVNPLRGYIAGSRSYYRKA